jgi:hypothetical protein
MTEMTETMKFPQSFHSKASRKDLGGKTPFQSFRSLVTEKARRYVASIPPARAGQRGHDQTFAVAVALVHGFALPEVEAWHILREYGARCLPPWSERELRHKLKCAGKLTRPSKPRGHLLGNSAPRPFPKLAPRRCLGRVAFPAIVPRPAEAGVLAAQPPPLSPP